MWLPGAETAHAPQADGRGAWSSRTDRVDHGAGAPSPRQLTDLNEPAVPMANRPKARGGSGQAQAWPSNMEVTEPSSKTSLIAREISGAMERQVSLSNSRSGASGSVLVTTISAAGEFFS